MKRKITLTPQIQAEIAIKAMKAGNPSEIAREYGISEYYVHLLKSTLMENAADLFLLISGDASILKALETVRDQIDSIQESLDEISVILSMNENGGEEPLQRRPYGLYDI